MSALPVSIEDIHPALWRGSQLARGAQRVVPTGHDRLSRELPGGGWPRGALIELLTRQSGVGELRLLAPALASEMTKDVNKIYDHALGRQEKAQKAFAEKI